MTTVRVFRFVDRSKSKLEAFERACTFSRYLRGLFLSEMKRGTDKVDYDQHGVHPCALIDPIEGSSRYFSCVILQTQEYSS